MIWQRIITALILIPITLGCLFYLPPPIFCIVTSLIVLGGAWEWTHLIGIKLLQDKIFYLFVIYLFAFVSLFTPLFLILFLAFIWWLIATVLVIFYPRGEIYWGRNKLYRAGMGFLTLIPCWVALNFIRDRYSVWSVLFLFALIWGADSTAYFVGRKWGKTKLAPSVSPGKSWQGLCGAILVCLGIMTPLTLWLTHSDRLLWPWVILISFFTVLFSVIGDLFESMLKRHVGLKDSGSLLPGHGGLLDRIDSLTAAAPIFAIGMILLQKYIH